MLAQVAGYKLQVRARMINENAFERRVSVTRGAQPNTRGLPSASSQH